MKTIFSVMLLALGLTACSQSSDAERGINEGPSQAQSDKSKAVQETAPVTSKSEVAEQQAKPKKKLDLSIPVDASNDRAAEPGTEKDPTLLSDMFVKSEAKTKIGGDVLRDNENEDYVDSIQGAQLNLEIKTD